MRTPCITPRERSLIQGLIDGKRNKIIAYEQHISEATVKVYFTRLFKKLEVDNRLKLARWGQAHAKANDLDNGEVSEFEILKSMVQTIGLTKRQWREVIAIMEERGDAG